MHIELLLEELSAEAALKNLLPKILPKGHTFQLHPYQGKRQLLHDLPSRLQGYRQWLPTGWRIVILIDEDREDCHELKERLEAGARDAGFLTKTVARKGQFEVVTRLAVEELEAWFFGDVEAVVNAYPKVPSNLGSKAKYRDPDAIRGGTWEALEGVLKRAGYCRGGMPKLETARNISKYMDPMRNRSRSFQVFRDGLLELVRQA